MNDDLILASLQVLLGLGWTWTCVCRIMRMDKATRGRIKWSFAVFGAGGCFFAVAPLMIPTYAQLFTVLAGAGVVYVQWATASLWSRGVPPQFKDTHPPADDERARPWHHGTCLLDPKDAP